MYKIITINGRVFYSLSEPKIRINTKEEIKYDNYNLDINSLYVEKSNTTIYKPCINEPIFDKRVLDISENSSFYSYILYENDSIYALLKQPLMIFYYPELLKKSGLLLQILNNYPQMIFTLLKDKYNYYIPLKDKTNFLIDHKLYPTKNLNKTILDLLAKNTNYMVEYIYSLIQNNYFSNKSEDNESYDLLFNYVHNYLNNFYFIMMLLTKAQHIHEKKLVINEILNCFYVDEIIHKKLFEYQETQIKYINKINDDIYHIEHEIGIIYKYTIESINYDYLCELILKKISLQQELSNTAFNFEQILQNINNIDDLDILLAFAKRGYPLSPFSNIHKCNIKLLYFELKYCPLFIHKIPDTILKDKDSILKLCAINRDILFKADLSLLNNQEFILEYIKLYSSQNILPIIKNLLKSKEFIMKAKQLDPSVIKFVNIGEIQNEQN